MSSAVRANVGSPLEDAIHKNNQDLWKRIIALDLADVKRRLCDSEGEGWSPEVADLVEQRYKRFLYLGEQLDFPAVPTRDIDTMFHAHILHTRQYMADCDRLFGHYIHHTPAPAGAKENLEMRRQFDRTEAAYRETFGEPYMLPHNHPLYSERLTSDKCTR